ncbi:MULTISPECIES: CPBP family intramembrane glutamic endopeptidase [Bifidobacterium]|nr:MULTISPECIES: CPBP family intramembrane glutamic endopeptidase [Bifidobacterium]
MTMNDMHRMLLGDAPAFRQTDLMTDDHPVRRYGGKDKKLYSAPLRGLMFVVVFIVAAIAIIGAGSGGKAALPGSGAGVTPDMTLVSWGELFGAIIAYLIVVMVMEGRRLPIELAPARALDLVRGGVASFACIAVSIGIIALLGGYRIVGFNAGYNPWADLLTLGLTAGVAEEIMMRGILLRLVEESLGSWGAVAVSALVFGLLHVPNPDGTLWGGIAIAIEAGLLFGAIYLATRSLWWCIGFHAMWNIAEGPIFGSIVSGTGAQQSWLVAQWTGPDLLTGGSFGLEASVVPVLVLGGLAAAILIHLQRHGRMIAPARARGKLLAEEVRHGEYAA